MQSTVTAKGQTTIPKAIRDRLGVRAGGKIKYFVRHDGQVVMLPVFPAADLPKRKVYRGPPRSIEEMDEAVAAEAAQGFAPPARR